MIAVLAPWILLSLAVGFLGRLSRGGFWGMFVFSMLFTPLVGGLAVLLAGPSGRSRKTAAQKQAGVRRAGAAVQRRGESLSAGPVWRSLVIIWLVVVAVFGVLFMLVDSTTLQAGFGISLDAATFRISGTNLGNGSSTTRALIGLEGFLVLVLVALKAVRLGMLAHDRTVRQMHAESKGHAERLEELQTALRAQQSSLDQLRAAAATPPPSSPLIIEHQG